MFKTAVATLVFAFLFTVMGGCGLKGVRTDREAVEVYNPLFFPAVEHTEAEAPTPFLGIYLREVPEEHLSDIVSKENAIYVDHVIVGTEAEKAGLLKGDIVVALDGEPLDDNDTKTAPVGIFKRRITAKKIGDSLALSVVRGGSVTTVHASVGHLKKVPPRVRPHPRIEGMQGPLDEGDSKVYHALRKGGALEEFTGTLAKLHEKSFLPDSFKVSLDNPFRLSEVSYLLQNPTNIIPVSREISDSLRRHIGNTTCNPGGIIGEASRMLDVELSLDVEEIRGIDTMDKAVDHILKAAERADAYRRAAFGALTDEETTLLREESPVILFEDERGREKEERLVRLLQIAEKIEYTLLFRAMAEVSTVASPEMMSSLKRIVAQDIQRGTPPPTDVAVGDVIEVIETGLGRIIIGGRGTTYYKGDTLVIIDLGGDDLYENNAGAATGENPLGIVIDLSGDDRYISKRAVSQGAGFMGIGLLADLEGNDTYIAEVFTQGAGVFGGGMLLDFGGDDTYIADSHAEGAGVFGIGLLLDTGGNDIYRTNQSSQGFGFTKGFGALMDRRGDDFYFSGGKYPDHRDPEHATSSLSQGFSIGIRPYESDAGASGGIGVLIDEAGDDRYIADYFAQGSSYWYSLGLLHDIEGDDTYIGGRYSQGAGIHISSGALIDEGGNDSYTVSYGVSQGAGHDFGIGVLGDFHGDDTYKGGVLSQGAVTCGSVGVLYDKQGKDTFLINRGVSEDNQKEECAVKGYGLLFYRDTFTMTTAK